MAARSLSRFAALAIGCPLVATGSARADAPAFNEIYASQLGVDDQEFIELKVDPNVSALWGVVCVVDGAAGSPTQGVLLAAWDIGALPVPADGYVVLGTSSVAGVDLVIGASDVLPDDTATYEIVHTAVPAAVLAQIGEMVDPELDGTTFLSVFGPATDLVTLAGPGIGSGDLAFDSSGWVGPDASAIPAGIFRSGDYDRSWCNSAYLDFDGAANASAPRTPGGPNGTCSDPIDTQTYCTAGSSENGCMTKVWTTGVPSATAGSGFHLVAGTLGAKGNSSSGIFFYGVGGRTAIQWGNSSSFKCVLPPVARGPLSSFTTSGQGICDAVVSFDLNARFAAKPSHNPGAGSLMQAQFWYRDPRSTSNQISSLSNAVEFMVQ